MYINLSGPWTLTGFFILYKPDSVEDLSAFKIILIGKCNIVICEEIPDSHHSDRKEFGKVKILFEPGMD